MLEESVGYMFLNDNQALSNIYLITMFSETKFYEANKTNIKNIFFTLGLMILEIFCVNQFLSVTESETYFDFSSFGQIKPLKIIMYL